MPIIKNLHTPEGAHIQVWEDAEELPFFLERVKLSSEEVLLLSQYSNERRKKDLLIARYLLQQVIPLAEVIYHPSGKPFLKGKEAEISISHSKNLVTVIIHKTRKVGIDIEYISPRVERVKHRFLSNEELTKANTTEALTLYWSAKETLFKVDEQQGLEFNTEITLTRRNNSSLMGSIRGGNEIKVDYFISKDWVMTYTAL